MLQTRFKNQQGFHLVGVLVIIIVIALVGFIGFWVFKKSGESGTKNGHNYGPNYSALPACGDAPLTTMPMDISRLESIGALGNINPPDHTLPTDHMYMMYPYGDNSQKDIFAPADIVVTSVSYSSQTENGQPKTADYAMNFYPCKELRIIFGHIDTLDGALASVGDLSASPSCTTSTQGTSVIRSCMKDVDIKIPAGTLIGTSSGWDFWATYDGFVSPQVTSPEYYHNVDAVCPLDYFPSNLQSQLYAKITRDGNPKCGEAYQDKANTLQGGWFGHKDPNQAKTDWLSHFSLVHDPKESGVGVLAIAGTIVPDDFMIRFTPKHSGTINREPGETTTGTVYCYQHEGDKRLPNGYMAGDGKVLLKLINNHEMQIDVKSDACATTESLTNPRTYYR